MQVINGEKIAIPYDDKKSLYTLFKKKPKKPLLQIGEKKITTPIEKW